MCKSPRNTVSKILVSSLIMGLLTSCSSSAENLDQVEEEKIIPKVSVLSIKKDDLTLNAPFVGVVKANKSSDIKSMGNGTVTKVDFEVGSKVGKNKILVTIDQSADNNETVINYNNALTSLNNALKSYGLTDALTRESINQAEINKEIAENSLRNAERKLENMKRTTANDIKTAEISLNNAKTSNILDSEVAATDLESAETSRENIERQFETDLNDQLEDARTAEVNYLSKFKNFLNSINNIIGRERRNRAVNDHIEPYIGRLNFQSIVDADNSYVDARDSLERLERNLPKIEDTEERLTSFIGTAQAMEVAIQKVDILLQYTVTDSGFPQESLDNLKRNVDSLESEANSLTNDIEDRLQRLETLRVGFKNQMASAEKTIAKAESNLQRSKQKIDDEDLEISVLNAKQQLENTKANTQTQLDNTQFELENARKQLQNSIAAISNAQKSRAVQLQNVREQIDNLKGQVELYKLQIADQKVRAPFSGTVISKSVEVGDEIGKNQVIGSIADVSKIKVVIQVSAEEINNIQVGQEVSINETLSGTVDKILPAVDANSRKFEVEIVLDNDEAQLQPESLVDVVIAYDGLTNSIFVPLNALQVKQDGTEVFVLEGNVARIRKVETGRTVANMVEVLSGLEKDESIIIDGLKLVKDGSEVEILTPLETQ